MPTKPVLPVPRLSSRLSETPAEGGQCPEDIYSLTLKILRSAQDDIMSYY